MKKYQQYMHARGEVLHTPHRNNDSCCDLLSPSYTVTILAMTELRLTPIYQVVMHRHES